MTVVKARNDETVESLLRRFKRAVDNSGVLAEYRKREYYEKPGVKSRNKRKAAIKRAAKLEKKLERARERVNNGKTFKWNHDKTKKVPMPKPKYRGKPKGNNSRRR